MDQAAQDRITRRALWTGIPVACGAGFLWWRRDRARIALLPATESGDEVSIVEFSPGGARIGIVRVPKVVRSEADWWARLTPRQFYTLRGRQTDPPFSGTYFKSHEAGLFRCAGCENALFTSDAKYDSGTGWPSFWEPIAIENVRGGDRAGLPASAALDSGIEVLCRHCDGHLGHIFGDGPAPTRLRYCINESALMFAARA